MPIKWKGTIDELKTFVAEIGLKGNWKKGKKDEEMFRGIDEHKINYFPTTHTISFQGPENKKQELQAIFANREKELEKTEGAALQGAGSQSKSPKIFIVHGHDKKALDELELFLRRLDLNPYILKNHARSSQTLIEALETKTYKNSAFGIILMTPDDWGYEKGSEQDADPSPRARQNVIFEMGMVIASLGRKRCAILKKQNLDLPSDIEGVIRYDFKESIKEIEPQLANHLREAEIPIDEVKLGSALSS